MTSQVEVPINAIVTGSRKYGEPRRDSDTDVALFVLEVTFDDIWSRSTEYDDGEKCVFDQVDFLQSFACERADVVWGEGVVDVYVNISETDRELLGRLHKWVPAKGGGFRSTLRNDSVNLIPVFDPEVWSIWVQGTEALEAAKPVSREDAIEFFTSLGMPRFNS